MNQLSRPSRSGPPLADVVDEDLRQACTGFGVRYGAALGGAYGLGWSGLAVWSLLETSGAPAVAIAGFVAGFGAAVGAVLGALGGFAFGSLGRRSRRPRGWALAGLAGGILAILPLLICFGPLIAAPLNVLPGVVGALVGLAVGRGVHRGQSRLPEVNSLARAFREADARTAARRGCPATELAPAATPDGRGDEVTIGD